MYIFLPLLQLLGPLPPGGNPFGVNIVSYTAVLSRDQVRTISDLVYANIE
jgi:hypothetical protein